VKRRPLAVTVVLAVTVLGTVAVASGSAQRPGERTITLVGREGSFHFLDNQPRQGSVEEEPPSAGDVFVGSEFLYTRSGRRAGTLGFQCTVVVGGVRPRVHCVGAYGLARGQLMGQTVDAGRRGNVMEIAITGGTGAYRGARGYVVTRQRRGGGTTETIHLLP
jgi:hypothetical protein